MRVHSLKIRRFKQFGEYEATFTEPDLDTPRDLVVLIGNNGKGKSTILQAIALVLGMATGRLASPAELEWPGFDYALAGNAWSESPEIEMMVVFAQKEIEAAIACFRAYYSEYFDIQGIDFPQRITINFSKNNLNLDDFTKNILFQGRDNAIKVLKWIPKEIDIFKIIGSVFWFHEHRSALPGDDDLRIHLDQWHNFHLRIARGDYQLRPGQQDLFKGIHDAWQSIFPGRSFVGSIPGDFGVSTVPKYYFSDGQRDYELAEMSGGERAILPILIDFARQNIHNSVVLIDEIELHLHPPLQQALVRALEHLGQNNQFIITTHSQSVLDVVFDSDIHRVYL
ncbi:MAG: AAA family ATPase [Magnetococcales bacterium]|nr:AAA family ATPase [Magnetococcales bacterium]